MSSSDYDGPFGDQTSVLGEETQPRTLYVGNLGVEMSEEFLHVLFSQIGAVKGCKIIHEVFLLFEFLALDLVSSVLWNVRPLVKVRLRPPRHQLPLVHHTNHPYHRAHTFAPRPRMPHHNMPVFSYRPPSTSLGSVYLKHKQPVSHSSNHQNHLRGPSHQNFHQDEILTDKYKLIKFESPSTNLVENSGYTLSSLDDSQHGYLSPKYKGWKPISKPNYQDLSQEIKSDRHTYPTTETYQDHKLMLGTLFRDNVKNIKPSGHVKLTPEFSENRGVAIPLPLELGGNSITLPSSIFSDRPQYNYGFYAPAVIASQSEEKPVIRKPFPKFQPKIRTEEKGNQSFGSGIKEGGNQEWPSLISKFKNNVRSKIRPPQPVQPQSYDNEPEVDGIGPTNLPKSISPFPNKVSETSSQLPMTFKEKFSKVRTRIRTRTRPGPGLIPESQGHVNTEDLRQVFSQQRPDHGPLETSINAKEAYRDPQRQQQHNSELYHTTSYTKNSSSLSPPYSKESHVSSYPERTRGEHGGNRNRPSSHPASLPEVPWNKISDAPNVGGSNYGLEDKPQRERKRKPNDHGKHTESTTPFVYNESPVYSEEFYLPPGFLQNPSLSGHNPVSFMTMPNSQPQVIHHIGHNGHPPQSPQQLYSINVMSSADHQKSKHNHGTSPNSNYAQNSRPHFSFMNIQNGQPTAPYANQEAPIFTSQAYDTGVTPQPMLHSFPFPTGSGHNHHGTLNSPDQSQPLRYRHRTSTASPSPRNPYAPSDSGFHSHYENQPTHHFDVGPNSQNPPQRVHQVVDQSRKPQHYSHINNDAYGSNEYQQIPMEFINHLRPILLDEAQMQSNSGISLQTVPASAQEEYHSSEMFPSHEYFDNFFKAYEVPVKKEETTSRYLAQQSGNAVVRIPYDSYKSSSNSEAQILKPSFEETNQTLISNNSPRWSPPNDPIVSVSSIHEYTFESTVSPIQDIELFERKPEAPKSWSKLKRPHGSGISSTEIPLSTATANKYKRLIGQGNLKKPEKDSGEVEGTTSKPSFFSSFSSIGKGDDRDRGVTEGPDYLKPTALIVTRSGSSGEDESSTPKSIRMRGTTESSTTIKTLNPQELESTTQQQKGTRPLRRRKAGIAAHRFFSSLRVNEVGDGKSNDPPVTTHRPRRLILNTSTGATMSERVDDSSESLEESRAKSLKARRQYFNRVNVHANRAGMIRIRATTPPPLVKLDAVTYGESQWFRIKDEPVARTVEMSQDEKSSSTEKLRNQNEEKTSFASRTLSTTPNTQLVPLEMSSESLIESESSSGKNFYEAGEGSGNGRESHDEPS